jgi:hypothetical protein
MNGFVGLLLALLMVAFLLRLDFVFYILYVCLGVYAWSRWYTPRALRQLRIGRHFARRAFWGETVPVTLVLSNENRLPMPWIEFVESVAVELRTDETINQVVALRGKETAEFTYTVRAGRRGYYQIGPMRVTTSDLFGLTPERYAYLPPDTLTVYPRIIPLTRLGLPSRLPFGVIGSNQRLFEDPARPMGVRDFRSGDSLRQINWKVSAHTRDLVVKTFQPAISLETAVLLNLFVGDFSRRERPTTIEWAIEVAASLATHLIDRRQAVGLMTNGVDPLSNGWLHENQEPFAFDEQSGRLLARRSADGQSAPAVTYIPPPISPRPGRPHLMKILERLARIEADTTVPFTEWLPGATAHLSWGVTVLAVTPRGDEATCQALHRLARRGFNPALIVVEPDYNFGRVRERARKLGFAAYHVAGIRDLDAWRRPVQVSR